MVLLRAHHRRSKLKPSSIVFNLMSLSCVCVCTECKIKRRRYSPARHTNSSLQSTPISIPRSGKSLQLSSGHSHPYSSIDSLEKAISVCTSSVPASSQRDADHVIYDTLAPPPGLLASATTSSLPPPSPRCVAPQHGRPLHSSMGNLGRYHPMLWGMAPGIIGENLSQIQKSKRRSNSLPDIAEQLSPDFPAASLKPISINRDLLELEESYIHMYPARHVGVATAAGGRGNGHVKVCFINTATGPSSHDPDSDIDVSDL